MALCENHSAVTLHVPFEHNQFLHRLKSLGYHNDPTARGFQLADTARLLSELLGMIPGLTAESNKSDGSDERLTHLRLILSASELALLPFELAQAPNDLPGVAKSWAVVQYLSLTLVVRASGQLPEHKSPDQPVSQLPESAGFDRHEKKLGALWTMARLLSSYDLHNEDRQSSIWAHSNLIELYIYWRLFSPTCYAYCLLMSRLRLKNWPSNTPMPRSKLRADGRLASTQPGGRFCATSNGFRCLLRRYRPRRPSGFLIAFPEKPKKPGSRLGVSIPWGGVGPTGRRSAVAVPLCMWCRVLKPDAYKSATVSGLRTQHHT